MAHSPALSRYSGRLARKGALLEETYRVFSQWDTMQSVRQNVSLMRSRNPIGATNLAWLDDVASTISSRFTKGDAVEALVVLAKGGGPLDVWKYCLLWHLGSTDALFAEFMTELFFPRLQTGVVAFTTEDVVPFVEQLRSRGAYQSAMSDDGIRRVACDLLRLATEFGFLQGRVRREVRHPAIPETAILYAIYSLWEKAQSVDRLLSSSRWSLFLMRPAEVEHELLNLHQFHRLRFEQAGSIRELSLPYANLVQFAQSLVA